MNRFAGTQCLTCSTEGISGRVFTTPHPVEMGFYL